MGQPMMRSEAAIRPAAMRGNDAIVETED